VKKLKINFPVPFNALPTLHEPFQAAHGFASGTFSTVTVALRLARPEFSGMDDGKNYACSPHTSLHSQRNF